MITADMVRCVVMLSFAALMAWTSPWGSWGPFLPLLLVGAFAGLFSPARSALLPTLIRPEQLVRANGMISGLGVIATMMALLIGGYLIDTYKKPEYVFRLDAATFVGSAVLLWMLQAQRRHRLPSHPTGFAHAATELVGGYRYAMCHRRVLELLAIGSLVWF